ncbi:hypothetical protein [Bifidobacterium tibiigranuli]|jgi:hypothetical protein|uniref:hypothetical protein n=1 Tax=Bifidobacterium tibiigranuli TaxID=2172043 RepID=UPI0026EDE93E|nr:hypothetical protein [Bifidobacterium tibiigranuli]MCI2185203.1 hypothetical protein [Bifidobacterium tibiigranuli]MCI2203232.1 hypothetical protein [Bifidobacterium tibiigranuli]
MVTVQRPPYRGHVFRFLRAASWPEPYQPPAWARNLQRVELDDGTTAYRCFPPRLDATAFADFTLLDRCGWSVTVTRHPAGIAVTIVLKSRPGPALNRPDTTDIPKEES